MKEKTNSNPPDKMLSETIQLFIRHAEESRNVEDSGKYLRWAKRLQEIQEEMADYYKKLYNYFTENERKNTS